MPGRIDYYDDPDTPVANRLGFGGQPCREQHPVTVDRQVGPRDVQLLQPLSGLAEHSSASGRSPRTNATRQRFCRASANSNACLPAAYGGSATAKSASA